MAQGGCGYPCTQPEEAAHAKVSPTVQLFLPGGGIAACVQPKVNFVACAGFIETNREKVLNNNATCFLFTFLH